MDIAIVGASVALPGVADLEELFHTLVAGSTFLGTVTDEEAHASGVEARILAHPNYVNVGTSLERAELFDRDMFGMTQAEALWTDPQQRLLLSLTQEALDSAAVDPTTERVGVWATTTASSYLRGRVADEEVPSPAEVDYRSLLGNDRDFTATRIAYALGLRGPALSVQSACSSSLVALHQAVLALAFGDADVAVAGAASVTFPQRTGYVHQAGGILSPTGTSRPFDASSDGTVRGCGGGAVVLRPLADALQRGDEVLAVLAGSAVNNDGARRMGYSAPSAAGQQDVLTQALRRAGTTPDEIGYIETHGTGTQIGDPIEFRALNRVYGVDRPTPCFLGAVKANFGHLDVAAGMVGLLKAVLAVRHGVVFIQPSFHEVNPAIPLAESVFEIPRESIAAPHLRWAAISSFGMGGTNAHVVIRRADARTPSVDPGEPVTVTLSARTEGALNTYRSRLADYLRANDTISLSAVAATLAARRGHDARWVTTVASTAELVEQLDNAATADIVDAVAVRGTDGGVRTDGARRVWLPPSPAVGERYLLPLVGRGQMTHTPSGSGADVRSLFRALVADELGADRVGDTTDFFDAGGESVALVSIVGKLTDAVGFSFDFDELDGVTEVGAMGAVLAAQAFAAQVPRDGLLTFGSGRPQIYFYPPAGGTNFCYGAMHRHLPGHSIAAFRAVRNAESVESIAADCVATLVRAGAATDGILLGGYSFGGSVAFEVCRQLIDDYGVYPGRLVLIDSFAPHAFSGAAASEDIAERVDRIVAEAVAADVALRDIDDPDVLSAFRSVWSANTRALATYRPGRPVPTPITLVRATSPLPDGYAQGLGVDGRQVGDWSRWTTRPVDTVWVPGDHYTIITDAGNVAAVATQVAEAISDGHGDRGCP